MTATALPHRRILIIGNSGSGKNTMARALRAQHGVVHLDLDSIAWAEPGVRLPLGDSTAALERFTRENESWVIEGSYATLARSALPHCTELRFLNPGVETCVANCVARPWEPEKYASLREQNEKLSFFLDWVRDYEAREDEYGFLQQRKLYDLFAGVKREYGAAAQQEVAADRQ